MFRPEREGNDLARRLPGSPTSRSEEGPVRAWGTRAP